MQFMKQKQNSPVTTCPQCDNVVRVDADLCNICGKRLKPTSSRSSSTTTTLAPPPTVVQTPVPQSLTIAANVPPIPPLEEYALSLEEEETGVTAPLLIPASVKEISGLLQRLQDQFVQIEKFFPADLPEKGAKLALWQKQIQRASTCLELMERPQFQQIDSQQAFKLRHHLAEAARCLDFTRQYTVKVIGHTGAGKSTLMASMIGQDIFPRLAGGAVTGVRTRIRLCSDQEPEELRVQFLSRAAFEESIKQTQQSMRQSTKSRAREALEAELAHLLKASEVYADRYLKEEPYYEIIPRDRWKKEAPRYIEEPSRDSIEPRLIRLVDFVEYSIHAGDHPLLPQGSVLIDLPGGSAGQIRHDAILREELQQVDAVILVIGNNRFGDDDRTQRIFDLVKRRVIHGRTSEAAAKMVFLAVTHWDEINSQASLEKAMGSLRPLLRDLPPAYASYHHHGNGNEQFFYPLRGLDALLATLGVAQKKLDEERLQEGREYIGRVLSVYPELLKIDSSLPGTPAAQDFQKLSSKQHQAMLTFSGLPELTHDLQTFLVNNRYEVQLRQAETQLAMVLQQLEDLCWENLNHLGVQSRDLQELEQEMHHRQRARGAARFELLQKRTNAMSAAWGEALKEFDHTIGTEDNTFRKTLMAAHERAAKRIKIHIQQGQFDRFIKVSNRVNPESPALEIGHRWIDIDGWNLIKALRISFSTALERELNEPARTLAEAFLLPIAHKEEIEGTLDITRVALGEYGGDLDEIQKLYYKLKRNIREKARDICFYVSMGELLNEEKYAPRKEDPSVSALYRLGTVASSPEDIILQARQLMGPILDVICEHLADSTEKRVAHLFRYELDKLECHNVYESDRLDTQANSVAGVFRDLINRLYSLLTERVITSEVLRKQLDNLQATREASVDRWVELLKSAEILRTTHRQDA